MQLSPTRTPSTSPTNQINHKKKEETHISVQTVMVVRNDPMPSHPVVPNPPIPLYDTLRQIIHDARQRTYQAINHAMVEAYWNIGRLIVE